MVSISKLLQEGMANPSRGSQTNSRHIKQCSSFNSVKISAVVVILDVKNAANLKEHKSHLYCPRVEIKVVPCDYRIRSDFNSRELGLTQWRACGLNTLPSLCASWNDSVWNDSPEKGSSWEASSFCWRAEQNLIFQKVFDLLYLV